MRVRAPATNLAVALALIALTALTARPAAAAGRDVSFEDWGIELTAPSNWRLAKDTPYEDMLLVMVTRAPRGTMMLTAQRIDRGTDSAALAERTRALLNQLGFETTSPQLHPATGGYWIDARAPEAFLRQAFIAAGERGYALALAADTADERARHIRAFEAVLRSISLRSNARAPAEP